MHIVVLKVSYIWFHCNLFDACMHAVNQLREHKAWKGLLQAGAPLLQRVIASQFASPMSREDHRKAYELMIRAHSAALLPPWINDILEYREYMEFLSRGAYSLPHRTKQLSLLAFSA